jgi:sulfide:quinone oxidoreductase
MPGMASLAGRSARLGTVRVVILGAGFGGLELATGLSEALGERADVVLIDQGKGFVFGFSKLDVMFGRTSAQHVVHAYGDLDLPGVRFVQATVTAIDPVARRVTTDVASFEADVLVVALGADLHPELTPGLVEGGHEFYTARGAFRTREVLDGFPGGRVVVGVTSTPFKCPPAPSEAALLVHEHLEKRGLLESSEVSLVMPFGVPIPPSPDASRALLATFEERGIRWLPDRLVRTLDPQRKVAVTQTGEEIPYDLFLGIPVHRAPAVVVQSGLTEDGWVPVDPLTLETRFDGVYAIGDVTSVGTPKAGVFSERQGAAVATQILAGLGVSEPSTYDGHGICYIEMGHDEVAAIDVTFVSGQPPTGTMMGPSVNLVAVKQAFGAERARRWFGRRWQTV